MIQKQLDITAILLIRNGAYYFSKVCQNARENGFSIVVIDNDSEDNLQQLIKQNLDVVKDTYMFDYDGKYDLVKLLQAREKVAESIDSDWIVNLDIDEILYSNTENETIQEALTKAHNKGFNAVNFDEFVFLPVQKFKRFKAKNYHTMEWYYFFEPRPNRLIRAFHKSLKTDLNSGGHTVEGNVKLYPHNMIMRHFMFENRKHAKTKYKNRLYAERDLEKKFHGNRLLIQDKNICLPSKKHLMRSCKGQWVLDKSDPKNKHFWQW